MNAYAIQPSSAGFLADIIRGAIASLAAVFTDVGEAKVADLWDGTASAPANWYIAWGTGSTTAAKGQTTLVAASAEARVAGTESQPSADVNRLVGTITSSGSQTIAEVGVFDASTVGNMVMRADFTGIALAASDSIQFTIDLTWA